MSDDFMDSQALTKILLSVAISAFCWVAVQLMDVREQVAALSSIPTRMDRLEVRMDRLEHLRQGGISMIEKGDRLVE